MKRLILVSSLAFIVAGCATKNYGRQGDLTSFEETTFTCREIDLESAKVDGFIKHVATESQFDGRDVLAILGDFGIGNQLEKDAALKSANDRQEKLRALRKSKACI